MTKISPRKTRALYRLLGEVRALGSDPLRWPGHALHGLLDLLAANRALCGIMTLPSPEIPPALEMLFIVGFENEAQAQQHYQFNASPDAIVNDPFSSRRFAQPPLRFSSKTRQEVVTDEEFYADPRAAEAYLSLGADQICDSIFVALSLGKMVGLMVTRAVGKPPFDQQDKRILKLFHVEMARMWRTDLTVPDELQIRELPPQLKLVLWMLASGDSEKQISGKLALSQHTVHDYVKAIYKHFDVSSRAELLAKVLRQPQQA